MVSRLKRAERESQRDVMCQLIIYRLDRSCDWPLFTSRQSRPVNSLRCPYMAISWVASRRYIPFKRISRRCILSKSISTHPGKTQIHQPLYISPVDAEPLHRYRQGGYHPVTLGECLKSGRYKVLHKLGWGGYSTVWVARDQRLYKVVSLTVILANQKLTLRRDGIYVAVKISVAEIYCIGQKRELETLKKLGFRYPRLKHTVHLLDNFDLKGPNGSYNCLVYELVGPTIPDTIDTHFSNGRLPGKLAKIIAKQSLVGLDGLHQMNIAHKGKSPHSPRNISNHPHII